MLLLPNGVSQNQPRPAEKDGANTLIGGSADDEVAACEHGASSDAVGRSRTDKLLHQTAARCLAVGVGGGVDLSFQSQDLLTFIPGSQSWI